MYPALKSKGIIEPQELQSDLDVDSGSDRTEIMAAILAENSENPHKSNQELKNVDENDENKTEGNQVLTEPAGFAEIMEKAFAKAKAELEEVEKLLFLLKEDEEVETKGRIKRSQFFKPAKAIPPEVATFLRLIVEGEQDKAEAMLKVNSQLGLASGCVKDLSKRRFNNITGLQYALWALDWNMWLMLLKYIPREEAKLQAIALEENGTEHGKHFDFSQLLGAYEAYEKNYADWCKTKNWKAMGTHWCKQVGGAQFLLPAHVVNEYCRPDRAFYPLPDFRQEGLPRVRGLDEEENDWYTLKYNGGKIGQKWGAVKAFFSHASLMNYHTQRWMFKGRNTEEIITIVHAIYLGILVDGQAIAALSEARLQQQQSLMIELLSNKPFLGVGQKG
jgi:hypothetical protein